MEKLIVFFGGTFLGLSMCFLVIGDWPASLIAVVLSAVCTAVSYSL